MSNLAQKLNALAIQVKALLKNAGIVVIDGFDSTSTTAASSANAVKTLKEQQDTLATVVSLKLDASVYNEHYKGTYTHFSDLQIALPTASLGNFALVDAGTGDNAHIYIWDAQEGWVQGGQTSLLNTDTLAEGSANKYFTNARVKSAFEREDATFAATALASHASSTNTVNIATRYQLLHITTSHPCRVRLYASVAQRDADLTRPIGTDPTGNHGLLFEFISTSELLSADLSPLIDGFSNSVAIPYSVTNLSGATQTITVTLNHVKTGA